MGLVVIPFQAVLAGLVGAAALLTLAAIPEAPDRPLLTLATTGLILGVRRFPLTVLAVAILALFTILLMERPAIALGGAAAPLLYAAWSLMRYALRPSRPRRAA